MKKRIAEVSTPIIRFHFLKTNNWDVQYTRLPIKSLASSTPSSEQQTNPVHPKNAPNRPSWFSSAALSPHQRALQLSVHIGTLSRKRRIRWSLDSISRGYVNSALPCAIPREHADLIRTSSPQIGPLCCVRANMHSRIRFLLRINAWTHRSGRRSRNNATSGRGHHPATARWEFAKKDCSLRVSICDVYV